MRSEHVKDGLMRAHVKLHILFKHIFSLPLVHRPKGTGMYSHEEIYRTPHDSRTCLATLPEGWTAPPENGELLMSQSITIVMWHCLFTQAG